MQALKQQEGKQQALVEKASAANYSINDMVGAISSRPPLVTRHAPNQQLPAQPALEQQQAAVQQQSSQVCAEAQLLCAHCLQIALQSVNFALLAF